MKRKFSTQNLTEAGREHMTPTKQGDADFELGWKEKIQKVQKPAFSSTPGINKNCNKTQNTLPWIYLSIFC
jgi:hypothetical protein